MEAKEYLEQARTIDQRITANLAQLNCLHQLMLQVSGSDSIAVKIEAMQEEINSEVDALVDLKEEIRQKISRLSKPEHRTVLELRYLCFWSWARIAANLHYSHAGIFKLHDAALKEFSESLKV